MTSHYFYVCIVLLIYNWNVSGISLFGCLSLTCFILCCFFDIKIIHMLFVCSVLPPYAEVMVVSMSNDHRYDKAPINQHHGKHLFIDEMNVKRTSFERKISFRILVFVLQTSEKCFGLFVSVVFGVTLCSVLHC